MEKKGFVGYAPLPIAATETTDKYILAAAEIGDDEIFFFSSLLPIFPIKN